jgi:hypothetical protein
LKNTHDFGAGLGRPVDIRNHLTPHCIVVTVVKNGKWIREFPTKAGTSTGTRTRKTKGLDLTRGRGAVARPTR